VALRFDGRVSIFWLLLFEAKTIVDVEIISLDDFANVAIDDFVLAVDDLGLHQRLPVQLAGEEVLEVAIHQRFVVHLVALQRVHPELPTLLHLECIYYIKTPSQLP
jgi:hypothetical protein